MRGRILITAVATVSVAACSGGSAEVATTTSAATVAPPTTTDATATTPAATTQPAEPQPATTAPAGTGPPTSPAMPTTEPLVSFGGEPTSFTMLVPPTEQPDESLHCTADRIACAIVPPVTITALTGDWSGELASAAAFVGNALPSDQRSFQYTASGLRAFSGRIAACGTGTVVIATSEDDLVPNRFQALGVETTRSSRWRIVPGTGTAELASATGGGTFTVTSDGVGGATVAHAGNVDCAGSPDPAPVAATGEPVALRFGFATSDLEAAQGCTTDGQACVNVATVATADLADGWSGELIIALGVHAPLGASSPVAAQGLVVFSGTIEGCGSGSITIDRHSVVPAVGSVNGNWQIVPGYGTADLATASGGGDLVITTDGTTVSAVLDGAITCS